MISTDNKTPEYKFDLFVSYASEDRDRVETLVAALELEGLRVWWDQSVLTIGDKLSKRIDDGLKNSRYGLVIISNSFIGKGWPENELRKMVERDDQNDETGLLPIRVGLSHEELSQIYPSLKDVFTVELRDVGLLAKDIHRVVSKTSQLRKSRATERKHVVFLIHGIRTRSEWGERVANTLESDPSVSAAYPIRYGFFDSIRFWIPIFRKGPVQRIKKLVEDELSREPTDLSVIAHSFGAYIIARVLREQRRIRLRRLILCGSIVPSDFDWGEISDQLEDDISGNVCVVNDCGTRDKWPVVASSVACGYGSSGRFGFGSNRVRDRFFDIGHGGFFEDEFVRDKWLPYIGEGRIVDGEHARKRAPRWLSLVSPHRVLVAVVVTIVAIVAFSSRPAEIHLDSGETSVTLSWTGRFGRGIIGEWQHRNRMEGSDNWSQWSSGGTEKSADTWRSMQLVVEGLSYGSRYEFQIRWRLFGVGGRASKAVTGTPDGVETIEHDFLGRCNDSCGEAIEGWFMDIPACGESGEWLVDCDFKPFSGGCVQEVETRVQRCR